MSNTSIYSKLTEKELLGSIPAEAHLFAEVNGETKRVPGYAMDIYATKEDLANIPTPDVSGQIQAHNENGEAHADIRAVIDEHTHSWNDLEDKPFGDVAGEVKIVPETTVTAAGNQGYGNWELTILKNWDTWEEYLLYNGEKYTAVNVIYDGVLYENVPVDCISGLTNDGSGDGGIGNTAKLSRNGEERNYPFAIAASSAWTESWFETDGAHTIEIRAVTTVVKLIDPKYMPDAYASIDYVDEQISEHKHSWDELEDKPFGEEVSEIIYAPEQTVKFSYDGALAEGSVHITLDSHPQDGASVIMYFDDEEVFSTDNYSDFMMYTFSYHGGSFQADGGISSWTYWGDNLYGNHTVKIVGIQKDIKLLDDKYIPSSIARTSDIPAQPDWNAAEGEPGHVLNRTHWVEESVLASEENALFENFIDYEVARRIIPLETHDVNVCIFDGTEYDLNVVVGGYSQTDSGKNVIIFGNPALVDDTSYADESVWAITSGEFAGNGCPFAIAVEFNEDGSRYTSMMYVRKDMTDPDDVDHSYSVLERTFHPISDDLIPSTIARTSDIPAQSDWNAAEGEPGHVLNRTHWVEETRVVIQENERQGAGPVYGAKEGYGNPTLDDGDGAIGLLSSAIVPGDTYIVTVNGVEYTGVAYEGGADIDGPGVHLFHSPEYGESWDTVEVPFSLNSYNGCMYLDGTGGFVKIEHVAKTTHPLPPALGGMPTLAADRSDAGKIVRVNAQGTGYELGAVGGPELIFDGDITFDIENNDGQQCYKSSNAVEIPIEFGAVYIAVYGGGVNYGQSICVGSNNGYDKPGIGAYSYQDTNANSPFHFSGNAAWYRLEGTEHFKIYKWL